MEQGMFLDMITVDDNPQSHKAQSHKAQEAQDAHCT